MTLQPLDHGILNVPLHKRGNIDAQLDKYKTEQSKQERKEFDDRKFLKGELIKAAKYAYEKLTTAQLRVTAKKHGITVTELREIIKVEINARPERASKMIDGIAALLARDGARCCRFV